MAPFNSKYTNQLFCEADYQGHKVYFDCTKAELYDPECDLEIHWVINQGEVVVASTKLKDLDNVGPETRPLTDLEMAVLKDPNILETKWSNNLFRTYNDLRYKQLITDPYDAPAKLSAKGEEVLKAGRLVV